jgi:hypothetical protein
MIKYYRVVVWKEDLTYLLQEIIRAGGVRVAIIKEV